MIDADVPQAEGRTCATDETSSMTAGTLDPVTPTDADAALLLARFKLPLISHHLAHDLRSPVIRTGKFLELLREDCAAGLEDDDDSLFDAVERAGQQSANLLGKLIDCSGVAVHALESTLVDLDGLIADVLEECQSSVQESGMDVQCESLGRLTTDADLLKMLCIELIVNACVHAGAVSDPVLLITLEPGEDGASMLCFRDNGPGFGVDCPSDLFAALELRARPDGSKGSGLGLTLCELVCHRLGFSLQADACEDAGACLRVVIPADHMAAAD